MRRVMLFTLLALALPMAVSADPFFNTGTFTRGTISRGVLGGLSTGFSTIMIGSTGRVVLNGITLTAGCGGTTGTCTFATGTVTVTTPTSPFMTLFTDTIVNGMVTKTAGGADITADALPVARVFPTGAKVDYFSSFSATTDLDMLTGKRAFVGVIPEPGTLCLLGTSVIGLAGMARRRLKLGR